MCKIHSNFEKCDGHVKDWHIFYCITMNVCAEQAFNFYTKQLVCQPMTIKSHVIDRHSEESVAPSLEHVALFFFVHFVFFYIHQLWYTVKKIMEW